METADAPHDKKNDKVIKGRQDSDDLPVTPDPCFLWFSKSKADYSEDGANPFFFKPNIKYLRFLNNLQKELQFGALS